MQIDDLADDGTSGDILIVDDSPEFAASLQSDALDKLRVWHLRPGDMPSIASMSHTLHLPPEFPALETMQALYVANPVAFAGSVKIEREATFGSADIKQRLLHLLAICRDRVGGRVIVSLDQECAQRDIGRDDMFSLGFHQLGGTANERLYMFSLSGYKIVPRWLNARYWANPERWNLLDGAE